ncbi:LexA family protein [Roseateles agri]|nr:S24 family peptidase [Paucibacter sp. R3-3]
MTRPNKDASHLKVLREHLVQEKVLPSYAKLGALLGLRGKAGAYKVIQRLVSAGYLEHTSGGRLAPTDSFFALPMLDDTLHAGLVESTSWSGGVAAQALDRLLVEQPASTVLVPVRGDSMIEAGVLDGDTAVVERTENAEAGDFVAALVDGQYTVKELRFEHRRPVLVPHNKQYETIRPQQELQILGVVRGIVRRYEQGRRSARKRGENL